MLGRQSSVSAFPAFAENEAYLAGMGHRVAALEDARLLPLEEMSLPGHAGAVALSQGRQRRNICLDPAAGM